MKRYSSYKDSGIAWIGQIPSHWEMRKMKFCFNERVDKNHPLEVKLSATQTNGVIPQTMYEGQGNRVVNVNTGFETLKLVKVGDFVIHLRSFQGGIEYAYYQGIISPAYTILEPQNPNYTGFYKFLFKSYPYIQLLKTCVTGIREGQNIDYKILGNKYIPIPPADEQEAIVRFITEKSEKIDRYIAEQERLLAALNELCQAEIARAVTRGLNSDAPLRDSGIDWIGTIPAHWDIEPMGRHFEFSKGLTITKANLTPTGVAVISYGQIHNRANSGVSISQDLVRYVPETYLETNSECLLRPNDFIFADTSEDIEGSGNCAFNDYADNIFAGYHTVIARPLDLEYPKYTAYLFQSKPWKEQVHQNVNAVKVYSINRTILKKTTILIPPLPEQRAIVEYLDEKTAKIDRMKADIEKQIGLLKEYKQRMISDAVTGKIDVRE